MVFFIQLAKIFGIKKYLVEDLADFSPIILNCDTTKMFKRQLFRLKILLKCLQQQDDKTTSEEDFKYDNHYSCQLVQSISK